MFAYAYCRVFIGFGNVCERMVAFGIVCAHGFLRV